MAVGQWKSIRRWNPRLARVAERSQRLTVRQTVLQGGIRREREQFADPDQCTGVGSKKAAGSLDSRVRRLVVGEVFDPTGS